MNGSSSARAHAIILILLAIKDFLFIFFKHIAHGSWFVNRQEINRLELFWLELLELFETLVPGPGYRRGAAENGRRFEEIN